MKRSSLSLTILGLVLIAAGGCGYNVYDSPGGAAGDDDDDDVPWTCGNGVIDAGEECDTEDLGGSSCELLGHTFGDLSCTTGCSLDRSGCFECGDGYGQVLDAQAEEWLSEGWEETLVTSSGWRRSRAIWALLEDADDEGLAQIHEDDLRAILRGWTGHHCPTIGELIDDDQWYWGYSFGDGCMAEVSYLTRILLDYPDRLPGDVLDCLEMLLPGAISMGGGNPNTEVVRWAPIFLMAQQDPGYTMTCPLSVYYDDGFDRDGNTYVVGNTYSAHDLARDFWLERLDAWVANWNLGNNESDNEAYTWLYLSALMMLTDFADRPLDSLGGEPDPDGVELQRRAQMVLDLLLMDNVLDYSANQHGGRMGRHYYSTIEGGYQMNFYDLYWDMYVEAARKFPAVSDYRIPYVLEDLGRIDDEPEGYWHVNRENDDYGKWTWVADDWNLGGGTTASIGYMNQWILNLRTNDTGDLTPVAMFVHTYEDYESGSGGYANALGQWGYLWRYAGLIRSWGFVEQYLHVVTDDGVFDEMRNVEPADGFGGPWEITDDYAFFREGDVMVAIGRKYDWLMSVEIAEVGVDYDGIVYHSLDEFAAAVEQHAFLGDDGDLNVYVTSRGDTIGFNANPADNEYMWTLIKPYGETEYTDFDALPVQERIYAEDWQGEPMVWWEGGTMTVQRHGCSRSYDFEGWTFHDEFTEECPICEQVSE